MSAEQIAHDMVEEIVAKVGRGGRDTGEKVGAEAISMDIREMAEGGNMVGGNKKKVSSGEGKIEGEKFVETEAMRAGRERGPQVCLVCNSTSCGAAHYLVTCLMGIEVLQPVKKLRGEKGGNCSYCLY